MNKLYHKRIIFNATNKIYKETAWSFLAKGIAAILFIGLNIFLARYLGPEKFGAWSYFYSILTIILLLSYLGINGSTKKYIAQFNNTDKLGSVLNSSLKIRVFFSLMFVLLFLLVHKPLANILGRPDFERLFMTALPLILFAGLVEFFKHAFEGLHRLKYAFYVTLSEHGLKLIITVMALFFTNGLIAIVYSFNLAVFITSLVGFYFYYFHFYKKYPVVLDRFSKEIMQYSIPLFFISIGFAVAVELDVLMIGMLSVDSEVGIYAVAKQIIVKLPHIALAISLGSMPVFAKLSPDNKEELRSLFYKLLKTNAIIFGFIGLLILATSWFFIPLLFGEEYSSSVAPLMVLVLYLTLFSFSIFISSLLDYQGKAKKRAITLTLTIVLNIIFNIILIPRYGAIGAAVGTSVSYSPYVLLNWLEVNKIFELQTK